MPTYIYRGDTPRNVADIGVDVEPGQKFESPIELVGEHYDPVGRAPRPPRPRPRPKPVKEVSS